MATTIDVHAARIPDRDTLLRLLREQGLDARAHDELEIQVPCGDDDPHACDELLAHVEGVVMQIGAPFVPTKHDDVIYIRPPVG